MIAIVVVEIINLWNLSNITEGGTYSLMFDFIALGIIAEFDDYFIEIYRYSSISPLIDELELTFDNTAMPKRNLPNLHEMKLEKFLKKIKDLLSTFKKHCSADAIAEAQEDGEEQADDVSYCVACWSNCKKTCWKRRNNETWIIEAQLQLSKIIINIIEYLRVQVSVLHLEIQEELKAAKEDESVSANNTPRIDPNKLGSPERKFDRQRAQYSQNRDTGSMLMGDENIPIVGRKVATHLVKS